MELKDWENKGWELVRERLDRELPVAAVPILSDNRSEKGEKRRRWAVLLLLLFWVLGGTGLAIQSLRSSLDKQQKLNLQQLKKATIVQSLPIIETIQELSHNTPDNNTQQLPIEQTNRTNSIVMSSKIIHTPVGVNSSAKKIASTGKSNPSIHAENNTTAFKITEITNFNTTIPNTTAESVNKRDPWSISLIKADERAVDSTFERKNAYEVKPISNVYNSAKDNYIETPICLSISVQKWHFGNEIVLKNNGISAGFVALRQLNKGFGILLNADYQRHWTGLKPIYSDASSIYLDKIDALPNVPSNLISDGNLKSVDYVNLTASLRYQTNRKWSFSVGLNSQYLLNPAMDANELAHQITTPPTVFSRVTESVFMEKMQEQNLNTWHFVLETAVNYRLSKHWELTAQGNLGLNNLYQSQVGIADYQHSAAIGVRYWWK